jgi:hypothetical protein
VPRKFTVPRRVGSAQKHSAQEIWQRTALCTSMHENGGTGREMGNIIIYIMDTFSSSTPVESLNNTALTSHHGTCACILQIRHLQFH